MPTRPVLATLAATLVALAACGGDDSEPAGQPGEGVRPRIAGSTAALANCGEWNAASLQQRKVTVEELRGQLTAQDDPEARSVLSDERAHELFDHACKEEYASELRLYKLYTRAQAFEPLRR